MQTLLMTTQTPFGALIATQVLGGVGYAFIFVPLSVVLFKTVPPAAIASALAHAHARLEAADLMRYKAAWMFDAGIPCGAEANMAKLLASEASWAAANACLDTHGGFGFAQEYDVERKFRETRLYSVAPVSNNLILAYLGQRVLGIPRSY